MKSLVFLLILLAGALAHAQETVVLVDEECISAQSHVGRLLRASLGAKQKVAGGIRRRALVVKSAAVAAGSFKDLTASGCVVVMADNAPVVIMATGPDTLLSEQVSRSVIDHDGAEKIFFHPLFGISQPITVAVVDTGIESDHPDLFTRLWHSPGGRFGYDFVNDDDDPADDNGHGTHVSGLIAAQHLNAEGIRGVIGDFSQIMALKTQDAQGNGTVADVVNAINFAAENGAEVINLSLAARNRNAAVEAAIKAAVAKNIFVVAAAGNDNQLLQANNFLTPASYAPEIRGLMSVGAFDALSFKKSSFSNFGSAMVEISAPGSAGTQGILSCFKGKTYLGLDGTSSAAPQVSGAAALAIAFLKSRKVSYTVDTLEQLFELTAVEDLNLNTAFTSGRRLNVQRMGRYLFNQHILTSTGGFDE